MIAPVKFEAALKRHVESGEVTEDEHDRIIHVLAMPERGFLGIRRKNILARMERRARSEMGLGATEAIDWNLVDWKDLIQLFLKILALFGI